MFCKIAAVFGLCVAALFASVGIASAQDYVPAPVTSSVLSVDPTSSAVVQVPHVLDTPHAVAGSLSYTGTGFNVGLTVAIAAAVVLLGLGLVIVGTRLTRGRSANHS